ncbi:MAG: hypothetical protein DCC67_15285 [Planctomycetota bacterium]|nr:MAG: hypothetical protein DCC67_15285 [Planctomycetota bacterium]
MSDRFAICVDGGGTKTDAWLVRFDARGTAHVLGRGRGASSNPRAVGLEIALHNLGAAIDAAWADAKLGSFTVDVALLALSGAGHQSMRDKIALWADRRQLATTVRFEHDVEPVLAEGTPAGWGAALIVGTGSAAIGVSPGGQRLVVGGWGYHYGDEGSAYWIGRRALEAVARAADGRAQPTAITAAVLERLQVSEPRAMLGALEQTGNVRGAIASLADCVERSAGEGDAVALHIVHDAADELAAMVGTLVEQLQLGRSFPLALAGGVICGSERLRVRLMGRLSALSLKPDPVTTVAQPVAGCVKLAWRALPAPP